MTVNGILTATTAVAAGWPVGPGPAAPEGTLLPPAEAGDNDAAPSPAAPTSTVIDPHDITKWDLTDLPSIPLGEQQFEESNITLHCSWHAALLLVNLVLLSDDIERLHPDVARTLHAAMMRDTRPSFYSQSMWLI